MRLIVCSNLIVRYLTLHIAHHSLYITSFDFILFHFRTQLCQALITASKAQDKSPSLLGTLVASLLSSFSPDEITSDSGKVLCAEALTRISALTRKGYLSGSKSVAQQVASLASLYTVNSPLSASRRRLSATADYPVTKAVSEQIVISSCLIRLDTIES